MKSLHDYHFINTKSIEGDGDLFENPKTEIMGTNSYKKERDLALEPA